MIGSTVGHYDIVRKIGGGGMGVVYLARDTRLDRPVALKFVRTPSDPGGASQLLREARAASALNHPGICTVHEVGESGSDAYIVMEYVEGETLSDRMAARPFSPDDVIAIGAQVAAALVHAHGRGVVHRDLKSANIVFGAENRIKVLDFGLSRRTTVAADDVTRPPETLTEAGVIAGTLAYMSPEVLRGGKADERADLWALAVTLFEMCASRRPFEGATPFEMSAAILGSEPPPLPPHVPAPLGAFVTRALSKDPGARFPTAASFRGALDAAARGRQPGAGRGPAHSRRPALREPLRRRLAGVLRGRHDGGDHCGHRPAGVDSGDLPDVGDAVQAATAAASRDRAPVERRCRGGRFRHASRKSRPSRSAARRCARGRAPLGRDLRPRPHGCPRPAGRRRQGHRERHPVTARHTWSREAGPDDASGGRASRRPRRRLR